MMSLHTGGIPHADKGATDKRCDATVAGREHRTRGGVRDGHRTDGGSRGVRSEASAGLGIGRRAIHIPIT